LRLLLQLTGLLLQLLGLLAQLLQPPRGVVLRLLGARAPGHEHERPDGREPQQPGVPPRARREAAPRRVLAHARLHLLPGFP
jgi:hypothetical protein